MLKRIHQIIHHLLEPHCTECREKAVEDRICQNCEYLKLEIEKKDQLIKELIDKLTDKPEIVTPTIERPEPAKPRFIPWNARRQMLEAEDRVLAQKSREAQEVLERAGIVKPQSSVAVNATKEVEVAPADDPDVIALEKEMGLIEKERTNAVRSSNA